MRLIATEEAFAPREYIDEYLKLGARVDTAASRYLTIYYGQEAAVRQLTDIEARLPEMDRFGVDMHVLSIAAPGVQAFDADTGHELSVIANDLLSSAIARHPTRFAGLAAVAPQDPERAAREIERATGRLGLGGVIINSHTHGEYLDDPKFAPVLAAAEAAGAPIYLHPTFPSDAMIRPYQDYGMMGALWGFGADASVHAVRMIMGGVFDAFPRLQVVLGHLGEALPFWLGRLDNRMANIVRRGGGASLGMKALRRRPSDYFRDNFHITTSGMMTPEPLRFCLELLGDERVMFAIDHPYERTDEAVPFFSGLDLPPDTRARIAHRNAERLFGIIPAPALFAAG